MNVSAPLNGPGAGEQPVSAAIECWIVTDGKAGMENQCLGLARALGVEPTVKRIAPRVPWRYLPPQLWLAPLRALGPESDTLAPPWPDLAIGSGRLSVAPMLALKRASPKTVTVQIQNPTVAPSRFEFWVAGKFRLHDRTLYERTAEGWRRSKLFP